MKFLSFEVDEAIDELDFFMTLLENGITLEYIKKYGTSDEYQYAKTFLEEHGLI